eukprot:Gb_12098 [translate_table: standard]
MCEKIKTVTDARYTTLYPKLMDKIHGHLPFLFIDDESLALYLRDRTNIKDPINWWTIHGGSVP